MSSDKKILLGMIIIALSSLVLGASIGYYGLNRYYNTAVLQEMKKDGYVITTDATATAADIVNGKTAYVNGEKVTGEIVVFDTSNATATSNVILNGKTAYVDGELVVGTLPVFNGQTVNPSIDSQEISGGVYLAGDIIIKGDGNLTPGNIADGVVIFNVKGTYRVTPEQNGGNN